MTLEKLVGQARLYLFDMDGTIYLGDKIFDFTAPLLDEIKRQGGRYLFITNNSSKNAADFVEKMARLGVATTEDEFVTSGGATAHFMCENYPDAPVYICGAESLKSEFAKCGLTVTDDPAKAEAVVLGSNPKLSFPQIENVCRILFTKNVPYIATHPDMTLPTEFGCVPDCGALADMIEAATGKRPVFIGKPAPLMIELAMHRCGCDRSETLLIGDRLDTDIPSGIAAGVSTVLVFSGSTTPEMLAESNVKPDLAIKDCGLLLNALRDKIM